MNYFLENPIGRRLLVSLSLFIIVLLLRWLLLRRVRGTKKFALEKKRRWAVNVGTLLSILLIVGMIVIWSNELRTVALSFVALAVAIVIATKELILCVSGAVFKVWANPFDIGDRIEIEGTRGDVIDRGPFSTKILEVGPGRKTNQLTGRAITIPNSMFINHPVINETYLHDFLLHTFTVSLTMDSDWKRAETTLLEAANEECERYLGEAQSYLDKLQSRQLLVVPDVRPRVHIRLTTPGEMELIVRITVPYTSRRNTEQIIIRKFLERFY